MQGFLKYTDKPKYGDTVIVYINYNCMYPVKLVEGKVFQSKYGALKHSDIIAKPFGSTVQCTKGFVHILFPTSELWTISLPHRTQIIYTRDISFIVFQLDLKPGSVVCESGTGSGSLTHALARVVAPSGCVYTFDFHEQRSITAREEFDDHGLGNIVQVEHRDVCTNGFSVEGKADAVFLDLPHPWLVVEHAIKALKSQGGRICSFSPCIEQVQRTCETLNQHRFINVETFECLERPLEVRTVAMPLVEPLDASNAVISNETNGSDGAIRKRFVPKGPHTTFKTAVPSLKAPGHTGYLTFATWLGGND